MQSVLVVKQLQFAVKPKTKKENISYGTKWFILVATAASYARKHSKVALGFDSAAFRKDEARPSHQARESRGIPCPSLISRVERAVLIRRAANFF